MAKIESCYHSSAHYHLNQQRSKHSILFMPVFRFARGDLERGGGGGGVGRGGEGKGLQSFATATIRPPKLNKITYLSLGIT